MPVYEYYCKECNTKFEKLQPVSASGQPSECPSGHDGALRTLSLVARPLMSEGSSMGASMGCGCGGNCSCGVG
jgi:putative FmdB family regulatory protein